MVCKNCGADLKPGIKYCLECGSYVDEEEEEELEEENGELSSDYKPVEFREPAKRKKKKLNLTTTDYLIYAGLLIVMIGSIIVIIVAVVNNNKTSNTPTTQEVEVKQPTKVTVDDYTVTVPAGLAHTVEGSTLTVSDNKNFSFSYSLQKENFDTYLDDHSIVENQLKSANYTVNDISEKTVNNKTFLVYDIMVNNEREMFYLTRVNSRYTAMGVINVFENGNFESALTNIESVNSSISF